MPIPFSEYPGRHERHYRRRLDNPLFASPALSRDDTELLEMQRLDHEELLRFVSELRAIVLRAIELAPNEGSEVILEIKEQLDRAYEMSAGLAEDQTANQAAICQLLEVIMRNVEQGAGADPLAIDELQQERAARAAHFELLRFPLVADLLHPQSTIGADELGATILCTGPEELAAALQLFDLAQLSELYADAQRCLAGCAAAPQAAGLRLQQVAGQLARLRQSTALN